MGYVFDMKNRQKEILNELKTLYGRDVHRTDELLGRRYKLLNEHSVLDSKILIAEVKGETKNG